MNNLTSEERNLVELFRCLTPEAQRTVLRLIRLMKKAQDEI